jgi:hypothetical protein
MVRKIILTVPHATNTQNQQCTVRDTCDSFALSAASILQTEFELNGFQTELIVGNINRLELDLNRIGSRFSALFRQKIRAAIAEKDDIFVLDVHSFPPDYQWSNKIGENVIVLFDFEKDISNVVPIQRLNGIKVIPGAQNDIMDEMLEKGIPSFLIELNENGTVSLVKQVARRLIAFWS